MFKFVKSIFTADERPLQLETEDELGAFEAAWTFNGQKTKTVTGDFISVDGTATIRQMKNGKFRLLVNQNEVVGTYGRKRDAIRGAFRKGLTVVEA